MKVDFFNFEVSRQIFPKKQSAPQLLITPSTVQVHIFAKIQIAVDLRFFSHFFLDVSNVKNEHQINYLIPGF